MFDFLLKLSSDFAQKSKQQHKITILANLFVSASIDAVLQNLNASEDIIQFFNDIQEPSIKGRVFSEFKKNPNLTADDLYQIYTNIFQEIENKQKKKLQSLPDTVIHAISIVSNPVIKIWIEKVVYKKFKDDLTSRNYEVDLPIIDQWANSIDKEELGNFNLENSNFDQVYDMVSRFIKEQQEGSASSEKKSGSLIYGPEWKNPQFNGYTIVELTEMPQLVYESECLGHCIGDSSDYFNKIKKQESRIFSLRDSSGKAIVTIETSYDLMSFKQIFGANNSQPNSWQIAMVNEWKNSLHPTEKLYEMAQDPSNAIKVAQFVSRGQHDDLIDMLLKSN